MRHHNRIAISNSKGGVGKTTTCLEIGAHAARMGMKVLFVDMDPQANTSSSILGYTPKATDPTIFELLVEDHGDVLQVIKKGTECWPNSYCLPCNQRLGSAYKFLESEPNWITALDEIIESIEDNFDLILIDTPPSMGLLTKLSIRAANKLLIPTDTSRFADDGDETIIAQVMLLEKKSGHKLDLIRMVLTLQQKRGAYATRDSIDYLKSQYNDLFLDIDIPHSVKVIEAQRMHRPPQSAMSILEPDHKLFLGYEKLTNELIKE